MDITLTEGGIVAVLDSDGASAVLVYEADSDPDAWHMASLFAKLRECGLPADAVPVHDEPTGKLWVTIYA